MREVYPGNLVAEAATYGRIIAVRLLVEAIFLGIVFDTALSRRPCDEQEIIPCS